MAPPRPPRTLPGHHLGLHTMLATGILWCTLICQIWRFNDSGVSSALYQNLESTNTLFLGWFACEWTCNQGVPRFPANGVREPIERGHRGAGGQGAQDEKGREGSSPFLWTTATVVTPRVNFFPALCWTDQPTPTVIEAASRLAPWPRPARPKRVGLRNKELLHPGRGQEEAERRS